MFNKVQTAALEVLNNEGYGRFSDEGRKALEILQRTPDAGMPATYYCGSDSYAMTVSSVEYFKTGDRAGQVKAVYAAMENRSPEKFSMTKAGRLQKKYEDGYFGSLVIGYARDYRDPSF